MEQREEMEIREKKNTYTELRNHSITAITAQDNIEIAKTRQGKTRRDGRRGETQD